jgi:hypothetical protein
MSMSEPFQPNLHTDDEGVVPADDLSIDDELAADGTPATGGESEVHDDLADLPENTVFRTPETGDGLSPEDLER